MLAVPSVSTFPMTSVYLRTCLLLFPTPSTSFLSWWQSSLFLLSSFSGQPPLSQSLLLSPLCFSLNSATALSLPFSLSHHYEYLTHSLLQENDPAPSPCPRTGLDSSSPLHSTAPHCHDCPPLPHHQSWELRETWTCPQISQLYGLLPM